MIEKKYIDFKIEIDNDLYDNLVVICEQNNTTPEILAQRFIEFCANPDNRQAVTDWVNKCREEGLV